MVDFDDLNLVILMSFRQKSLKILIEICRLNSTVRINSFIFGACTKFNFSPRWGSVALGKEGGHRKFMQFPEQYVWGAIHMTAVALVAQAWKIDLFT